MPKINRIRSFLLNAKTAWIVLALTLLATLWAWQTTRYAIQEKERLRFDYRVQEIEDDILERMQIYEQVLRGAAGLFAASQNVAREEWKAYVESLNIHDNYPGIQGIGFSQWIPAAQKDEHVQQIRAEGFIDYDIKPLGPRPQYSSIVYIEPFEGRNLRAFGYDMFSEAVRRRAMERARDTGTPTISGKVTLIQEVGVDIQKGMLLYLPVYAKGTPQSTPEERRKALLGFAYAAFRANDFMEGVLGRKSSNIRRKIDFEIFDGPQMLVDNLLYNDGVLHALEPEKNALFVHRSTIEVQGKIWTLFFSTLPAFDEISTSPEPNIILFVGLLLSIMLFGIIILRKRVEDDLRNFNEVLEQRVKERTHELEMANKELESFSYSIAHDLRTPLRALSGFSQALAEDYADKLDHKATDYLSRIQAASLRTGDLIDDLLKLARISRIDLNIEEINVTEIVKILFAFFRQREFSRNVTAVIAENVIVQADSRLLKIALENLIGNAWKFTRHAPNPCIEFGTLKQEGNIVYFIRDNGIGFNMKYVHKLFKPFERLHSSNDFEGTGIGLCIASRIISRHGGRIWAQGEESKGATIYFTLPEKGKQISLKY